MTPLSVEYCRRARVHLAAIGSPLAGDMPPEPAGPAAFRPTNEPRPVPLAGPLPPAASRPAAREVRPGAEPARVRVASAEADGSVPLPPPRPPLPVPAPEPDRPALRQATKPPPSPPKVREASLAGARVPDPPRPVSPAASGPERSPTEKRREMWAEHDRRLAAIAAKTPRLRIMSGF